MRKWIWITLALIIMVIFIGAFYSVYTLLFQDSSIAKISGIGPKMVVTEENLPIYLSANDLVKDLPSGATISLKTTDKEYIVKRGQVKEGVADNPDIIISIPSSYIPKLNSGFCPTLEEARANGDLFTETRISKLSLAWKYRSVLKYKSCLGL